MLYIFMGQSCTGKSTVADNIQKRLPSVQVFAGKDYLRMAKNQAEAWELFYNKLFEAAHEQEKIIIYIITEKEQLDKVNFIEGSCKIKFTASLETIKSRFSQRMHGNMPPPIASMLEKQYSEWESVKGDMNFDTTDDNQLEEIINSILE